MTLVSIQLNSNRPDQIRRFFDSVEETADRPEDIEVLLHIDTGDTVMEEVVEHEKRVRRFRLVTLQTDLVRGYSTLWKPLNPLLKLTDPEAYFLINLSDEMLFETKGWDSTLRQYVGYYPDHLFRLRGSKYRFRNYTDYWECGFAPDSLAFYTRRWLELQGEWNPCLGPDSFQQCVAFYLMTSDPYSHRQFYRDIPLPHMKFSGEGASIGLEGRALYKRMCINNRAWFVLMSHKIQQEARRRAIRMKSHMVTAQHGGYGKVAIAEDTRKRKFILRDKNSGQLIEELGYKLSWLRITLTTWLRSPLVLYYAGGGRETIKRAPFSSMALMLATYLPHGTSTLEMAFKARDVKNHVRGVCQHHGMLVAIYVFMNACLRPFLPTRLRNHLYKHKRMLRDRVNHVSGVRKTHGTLAGTWVLAQSMILAIVPPSLARRLRGWKRGIRDSVNHVRGVTHTHGLAAGSWVLLQSLILAILPFPVSRPLRAYKRFLRDRSNHIKGVRQHHGIVMSSLTFLQSGLLAILPPPFARRLGRIGYWLRDVANHMRGVIGTHGFFAGTWILFQSLLLAALPKWLGEYLKIFKRIVRDSINHLRGVKKTHGLIEGGWVLTRSSAVKLSPKPLRRGVKRIYYIAHHRVNHVKGVRRGEGLVKESWMLSQRAAAACLPKAIIIPLRSAKHEARRKAGYIAHTYRVRGPLKASSVLAQESILAVTPRPVGSGLRYVKRQLRRRSGS